MLDDLIALARATYHAYVDKDRAAIALRRQFTRCPQSRFRLDLDDNHGSGPSVKLSPQPLILSP
jgi:hypothetical protein